MAADKPSSKGQAWFCATGLPSDIIIEVDDMTFHLHKFPLISKSRKLDQLIEEQGRKSATATVAKQKQRETETEIEEETEEYQEQQDDADEEGYRYRISLQGFPGGSDTFETAAKFCYGVKIDLSSSTIVPLRCAAEFLEMTDEYSEDNLISKTERFLSQSIFKSLKESIKALKSCESVVSLAESLGIVQRLIDSIASRASSVDPTLFGWPVNEGAIEAKGASTQALWNGIETGLRRKALARTNNLESWFEDLAMLSLPLFKRFILTLKRRDLSPEVIESCLMCYAKKYIPGTSRSNRKPSSSLAAAISESEQRELLETIISNLPLEKTRSSTAMRFLFGLLRTANILNSSEPSKAALEKKIGFQLEQATLDDLLIPSYSYLNETLYDVDCIERILGYFLDGLEERSAAGIEAENEGNDDNIINSSRLPSLMLVGKLIDGYLCEIASDANLKPDKFYNLAISLPDQARNIDDGLYRAVDVYLKAHPWIPESEREKICGVLDCQKLTLEACTHAAQNERLPLRLVVQVLFFEQLQLRHAIAGTLLAAEAAPMNAGRLSETRREGEEEDEERVSESRGEEGRRSSSRWRVALRENQVLRLDMDSMRTRVHQLERECSTMKKGIQKIEKEGPRGGCWRGSLNKRFGCKFKTQVCDSHGSTVAETRRGRHHHQQ
ncbi:BTB/POZ domain-containing protein [Hibiscus syriacus]|uniref:BTB/POZ domain-containing protein n=1 Tax=Hibiscus syriacus TaxID=106335 RepID=A0A6A3ASN4_HIBSY|nr:BTB/POZ domain-containing protein At5g66560-like [Hibiscus syriacus]XP_038996864.1 BTB/POZ domain-containing protein At5g66560-like [Hibiscus syriacus]KAE8707701.1 BTB/POZ domain-containing protein [Hibiscus syriacus]